MDYESTSFELLGDNNNRTEEESCDYAEPVFVKERFWMVAIFGTAVCIINIIENTFLSVMLFKKKSYRSSHMLYLALLAFFDVWMAIAYIPLMSLNLFVDYYQSVVLLRAWFAYMLPMITVSHIAMTASSFLMVAASLERYVITCHPTKTRYLQKNRVWIAAFSIMMGVTCKFSQLFEMDIKHSEKCVDTMREYQLSLSSLALHEVYSYWRVLFRTIVTILIPFFLLAFINVRIVLVLSKNEFKVLQSAKLSDAKRKSAVRNATRTLVFVVFTYLLSNVLNVIIILWEYIDMELLTQQFETFYMFAVDVVSLSTIVFGALRLPIYVICQTNLRKEFAAQLKNMLSFNSYSGYLYSPSKNMTIEDMDSDRRTPADPTPKQYPILLSLGSVLLVESDEKNETTCKVIRQTSRLDFSDMSEKVQIV
uniref:G_PROTEIN_RECEP_F1_2 domain-containing protein n=2 Tax=Caenorhabditis japonica TaxID=281687 RepID=A0A8R1I307_CAEJA